MEPRDQLTEAATQALAGDADLPLPSDRVAGVTALLNAWLPEANALSRRMRAPELDPLLPAVIFSNPAPREHQQ